MVYSELVADDRRAMHKHFFSAERECPDAWRKSPYAAATLFATTVLSWSSTRMMSTSHRHVMSDLNSYLNNTAFSVQILDSVSSFMK
jgi:hypothetical protein